MHMYWSLILQNKTDCRSTTELQNQGQESRTQDCRFDHGLFLHRDSMKNWLAYARNFQLLVF